MGCGGSEGVICLKKIPLWEKSNLTLEEASAYSGIGVNKLREISNEKTARLFYGLAARG